MKKMVLIIAVLVATNVFAQSNFADYQKKFPSVAEAMRNKLDTLKKQFAAAGLQWSASEIYIRSFKYDSQLEVWVRNKQEETFKLFKTYKVCALAGTLGPKRMEGDYQVPEGCYCINEFKPNSSYHLSLGINYPNASDKILSNPKSPGSAIFIHGSCVTVGCIPIQDYQIEELYLLATMARSNGQDFIPVHIFPVRFDVAQSVEYYNQLSKDNKDLQQFENTLKEVYDYFNKEKKLPFISINNEGKYIVME